MTLTTATILITGAARRVGASIAAMLAQKKTRHLILHYHRSEAQAHNLAKRLVQSGATKVSLISADLSRHNEVLGLAHALKEMTPAINGIVFNASIYERTTLGRVTETDWNRHFDINLKSVFFLSQKLGLAMKKNNGGKIVLIGDWSGLRPYTNYIPYCLSKTGVLYLTQALAKALAPKVTVNCVLPGPVLLAENSPAPLIRKTKEATLLKRLGTPQDVARAVAYFLQEAPFSTGAWLTVDGGRLIA